MKPTAAILLTGALCLCGCEIHIEGLDGIDDITIGGGSERGSGVKATETRDLPEFTSIVSKGAGNVTVEIGDEQSVEVEIDDNLLELIKTEVKDGKLVIDSEKSYSSKLGLHVRIKMVEFKGVMISGSGNAKINGVAGGDVKFQINGSGDVDATGTADEVSVSVNGSGDVSLFDLEADEVNVKIAGSGDVRVHAVDELNVRIMGSGDVTYKGDPEVDTSIMGSGDVERK